MEPTSHRFSGTLKKWSNTSNGTFEREIDSSTSSIPENIDHSCRMGTSARRDSSNRCRRAEVPILHNLLLFVSIVIAMSGLCSADDQPVFSDVNPVDPVPGTLFIVGGGPLPPEVLDRYFELAGGEKARIVIIPTANILAGTPDIETPIAHWRTRKHTSIEFMHTRDRLEADRPAFSEKLLQATAIWIMGGNQNWLAETYLGTLVERRCHDFLARGGVIGGTSAGAAVMSKTMIAGGKQIPILASGFGFLPGTVIDQHFKKRNRFDRLKEAVEQTSGLIGLGIDESTALVVQGRTLQVIGNSDVTVLANATESRPIYHHTIAAGQSEDLIKLNRLAIARVQSEPRLADVSFPEVKRGTLVIVGGGTTPKAAIDEFL
ncbi:MAG: cyanophycinase, partial [Planctomycetes bacterium]|nr:cyanophycinase [Planctomycetota bacterium]